MQIRHFKNLFCLLIVVIPTSILSQNIRIDHVIAVYKDLDSIKNIYTEMGFTIKPGRLHENGLTNAHIKFKNGSGFELMSVSDGNEDHLSSLYKALLNDKEGGVYVCLTGLDINEIAKLLRKESINYHITKSKLWTYMTFPDYAGLEHFFIINYHTQILEKPVFLKHPNGCYGYNFITIEGNENTSLFLKALGLVKKYNNNGTTIYHTSTGQINLIDMNKNKRPRITEVSFYCSNPFTIIF